MANSNFLYTFLIPFQFERGSHYEMCIVSSMMILWNNHLQYNLYYIAINRGRFYFAFEICVDTMFAIRCLSSGTMTMTFFFMSFSWDCMLTLLRHFTNCFWVLNRQNTLGERILIDASCVLCNIQVHEISATTDISQEGFFLVTHLNQNWMIDLCCE